MSDPEVALIVGAGAGLGAALARRFAAAGFQVAIAARTMSRVEDIASTIGPAIRPYACDVTDETAVEDLFAAVASDIGAPHVVIHNASAYVRKSVLDSTAEDFESSWRITCRGGFLVGRTAARKMVERGSGSIMFTGATSSLRGSALFLNFAAAKFGLRAVAQSMARELQPRGIHVAHVVIDGPIESESLRAVLEDRDPESFLKPDDIAEAYYQLHRQRRGAWTQELDVRSWKEGF